jgi:hypothetical protein
MLDILRSSPITTDGLTICFDRQPDIFAMPAIKYEHCHYLGYFKEDMLMGFALNGYYTALVNKTPETVFHFTDLYVAAGSRGLGFVFKGSGHFARELYHGATLGYGIIMENNHAALSHVGRRHPRYPLHPWTRIINKLDVKTILLARPVSPCSSFPVRRATPDDIPAIVSLLNEEHKGRLFGLLYSEKTFMDYLSKRPGLAIDNYYIAQDGAGGTCGVCAAWDCTSFKQNRILKYGARFLPARIAYAGLSMLYSAPPLPREGDIFRDVTITDYAAADRNPGVMNALIRAVYVDYREAGYHSIIWGSAAEDPLLRAAKGFFSQSVISNIVLISTDRNRIEGGAVENNLPYIDVACL